MTDRVASGDLRVTCDGESTRRSRLVASGHPQDDSGPSVTDRQDSAIEHHPPSTATEIAATSRQQEQSVYDYSASTNQAAAAVNQISATSQELLKTMNEVNQVANQTSRMAATGQQSLAGMDLTMRQLAESTGRSVPSCRLLASVPPISTWS